MSCLCHWLTSGRQLHFCALLDLTPADETPVLLNTPAESNLFLLLCADRGGQLQLGQIMLDLHAEACKPQRSQMITILALESLEAYQHMLPAALQ